MKPFKTLYVATRAEWRAWLEKSHQLETEIWLVYYKKHTGKPRVPYNDAVEEAICFGWIDSIVKRIDDERFAQKFTPRTNAANWSELNKERARVVIKNGLMTPIGLAKLDPAVLKKPAVKTSSGSAPKREEPTMPPLFKAALKANPAAAENFRKLAPSHQRHYLLWITQAKREETQEKRSREAIDLLTLNKKLGLK